MLNTNELSHEYFEELCSLAALGRIPAEEYELLKTHLQTCSTCRSCLTDFNEILHEHLPLLDTQEEIYSGSGKVTFHDASYKHRFVQKAAAEGIHFSKEFTGKTAGAKGKNWELLPSFSWLWGTRLTATAALLILGVTFLVMGRRIRELRKESSVARQEISKLESVLSASGQRAQPPSQLPAVEARSAQLVQEKKSQPFAGDDGVTLSNLQQALHRTQSDYESTLSRSRSLEEQLQAASNEVNTLRTELLSLKSGASASAKSKDTEIALQQVTGEVERLRREKSQTTSVIAVQQNQLQEINDKLAQQTDKLESERELFATSREIRNLMGSRNLHIIDVADVDSRGTQRPFGRVFYTEGKSLLFYAYDLEKKKKSLEKFSFQAWGQLGTKSGSVQTLGLFQADDQAQNRWVLRCDDPALLAQIDSVFVTIEPKGGSARPQGQQLMYAFLKANPNHP